MGRAGGVGRVGRAEVVAGGARVAVVVEMTSSEREGSGVKKRRSARNSKSSSSSVSDGKTEKKKKKSKTNKSTERANAEKVRRQHVRKR